MRATVYVPAEAPELSFAGVLDASAATPPPLPLPLVAVPELRWAIPTPRASRHAAAAANPTAGCQPQPGRRRA